MPSRHTSFVPLAATRLTAVLFVLTLLPIMSLPASAEIELFGGNPLFEAIKANNPQRVEEALAGGEKVEVQDFDGRRAIIYAALVGSTDIVEILIRQSALLDHRDKLGNCALYYAASRGDADVSEALIQAGAKMDISNRQGVTPLIIAAKLGHQHIVQLLLEKGANANLRDYTGRSALMWAEWNRKPAIARILRQAGASE